MKIEIEITPDHLAQLFCCAIEGGDPVTSGWCESIDPAMGEWSGADYAAANWWDGPFTINIVEVDDEETGHTTTHTIDHNRVAAGLAKMAKVFPHQFGQIMCDEIDAACADAFLQAVVFGEEKYA